MLITGIVVKAQAGIVYDPTNWAESVKTTAEVIQLTETMKNLKKLQEGVEKAKESVDWIRKAQSIVRMLEMIESTVCMLEELHINMGKASKIGNKKSCFDNIEYDIAITKLILCIDQINSTLTSGVKMTSADRWSVIAIALNSFSDSQIAFSKLNKQVEKENEYIIITKKIEDKEKKEKQEFIDQMVNYYN